MLSYKIVFMRISHVKIENFRAIQNLDFECGERINVFVGVNGAGKSTFLSALNYLFSWFFARIKNAKGRGAFLTDKDITIGKKYCSIELTLNDGTSWKLYKHKSTDRSKPLEKTELDKLTSLVNQIVLDYETDPEHCALPLFVSYGVNRSVTEVPVRLRKKHAFDPMQVYNMSVSNSLNFRDFFEWYREREDIENEQYRRSGSLVEDSQIKAVREAISQIMPGYGNFRVQRNPRAVVMDKGDTTFYFEQLSEGEKCYITLVSDIARRLAIANPNTENSLDGKGIVLIDEVDLHLHPTWQSEVVARLRKTFSSCQFFLTTHSPHIVSNIKTYDNEKFVPMEQGAILQSSLKPFGQPIDLILLNSFQMKGLRNQEMQEHIDKLWSSLEKKEYETDEFNRNFEWLKRHLDPSDEEFVRIMLEKAKLKKEAR